jgi:hypothetical protein
MARQRTFREIPDFFALFCPGTGLFRSLAVCKALAMSNSIIIWDLEIVPDLRGYDAANESGCADDEVRRSDKPTPVVASE